MYAWQATVQDEAGNIVPLPVVTVYRGNGSTLASIFNEAGAPLPNPLTGTMEGFVQFWANPSPYKVVASTGGMSTEVWHIDLGSAQSYPTFEAMAAAQSAIYDIQEGEVITAGGVNYIRKVGSSVDGVSGVAYAELYNSSAILATSSPLGELASSKGEDESVAALGIGYRRIAVVGDAYTYSVNSADHLPAVHQVWPDGSGAVQIDVSGLGLSKDYVFVNNGSNNANVIIDGGDVRLNAPWVSSSSTVNRFILSSGETVTLRRFISGQIFVQLNVSQLRWVGDPNYGTYYKKESGGFWTVSFVRTPGISANSESISTVSDRFDLSESYLESITMLPADDGSPYLLNLPQVTKISTRHGLAVNQFSIYNNNSTIWNRPVRFTFSNVKEVFSGF